MAKKSVGIWLRVSTKMQVDDSDSLEHHEERARMYAKAKNWNIKEIYRLEGVSGKNVMEHPEAHRMFSDIQNGKISGLIFSKISRLARSTKQLLEISELFEKHNADLISIYENIDTSSPAGKLFFTLIGAMAQWEREEIASRVKASVEVRAKLGKRLGGKVPFGYDWDGHNLILNEKEAPIRKLIFTLFLEEKRKKTVARILNERGYTTRNGGRFYDTNVKRWLRDPLSKGVRISNHTRKKIVDGKTIMEQKPKEEWYLHKAPRIVSDELWQKVNDILDEQENSKEKPANKKLHLFTKYIYCECGSRMYVTSGNTFYYCKKKECNNKIRRDDIENIFKEQLTRYVHSKKRVKEYLKLSDVDLNDKKKLLKSQIQNKKELNKRIEKIIQLHIDDKINKKAFKQYHDEPYDKLQFVEKNIIKLEKEIRMIETKNNSIDDVMKEAQGLYDNWDKFNREKKRKIVEMIVRRITIGKDDRINIKLVHLLPKTHSLKLIADEQHNQFL